MGLGSRSRSAPVPGRRHVSRPLIQRVQVLLLEALLQVGHAGVGVLAVEAPSPTPSSTPTPGAPTPSHSTAAVSGWGRGHALEGLCWWWELGAHGLPRRALIPGTEQSQVRPYGPARPPARKNDRNVFRVAHSPAVDGETVAGQRLRGGSGVHVASVGPAGRGRFRGVMLLHRRHGGPRTGALGSPCTSFLLIGTKKGRKANRHACCQSISQRELVCVFVWGWGILTDGFRSNRLRAFVIRSGTVGRLRVSRCEEAPGIKALLSTGVAEALLVTAGLARVRTRALRLLLDGDRRAVKGHRCRQRAGLSTHTHTHHILQLASRCWIFPRWQPDSVCLLLISGQNPDSGCLSVHQTGLLETTFAPSATETTQTGASNATQGPCLLCAGRFFCTGCFSGPDRVNSSSCARPAARACVCVGIFATHSLYYYINLYYSDKKTQRTAGERES